MVYKSAWFLIQILDVDLFIYKPRMNLKPSDYAGFERSFLGNSGTISARMANYE